MSTIIENKTDLEQLLATAVQDWLDARLQDPARIQRLEQRFTALHDDLQRDTPRLAAHAIQNLLA